MKSFVLILCLASLMVLPGRTAAGTGEVQVHRDLVYESTPQRDLKLDLYLPETSGDRLPVIVWIHGGGWVGGNKDSPQALRMTHQGYAVASIEYRFITEAPFPAQIEDCKAAIRWIRAHADEYQLDPERVGVWGVSAGGHLAALLGTTGGLSEFEGGGDHLEHSSRVQAVCDFNGPTDLLQLNPLGAMLSTLSNVSAGLDPEMGESLSRARDMLARANPIRYITPDAPPFLIMHGDRDPLVPVSQSKLLHQALQEQGVESELKIIAGAGHYLQGEEIDRAVDAFFSRHLKRGE